MQAEGDDAVLREQIAYYRARAPEYDEAYRRTGLHDRGNENNRSWLAEIARIERSLREFPLSGSVLEIACGTGRWTPVLSRTASEIVAVDSSPEMIERARDRVKGSPKVRFVEANIFDWKTTEQFDVVFFAFWLSHVPEEQFEDFWGIVRESIRPGGHVFLIDDLGKHDRKWLERRRRLQPEEFADGTVLRRLNDGREYRIVKITRTPEDLTTRLSPPWMADDN